LLWLLHFRCCFLLAVAQLVFFMGAKWLLRHMDPGKMPSHNSFMSCCYRHYLHETGGQQPLSDLLQLSSTPRYHPPTLLCRLHLLHVNHEGCCCRPQLPAMSLGYSNRSSSCPSASDAPVPGLSLSLSPPPPPSHRTFPASVCHQIERRRKRQREWAAS
jgi:hypothetical protein